MDAIKKFEILSDAYASAQNMLVFADSKASISLTIQTMLIGIGLGASLLSNSFANLKNLINSNPILFIIYILVAIAFVTISITGILVTIYVFKPRQAPELAERERHGLLYFGHIIKYKSSADYLAAINKLKEEDLQKEYSQQIYVVSAIAKAKMKNVNISVFFLLFNIAFTTSFLILSGFINLA